MFPADNMYYGSKQSLLHTFSIPLSICKLAFLKPESLKILQQIVLITNKIFLYFSVYHSLPVNLQIAYQDLS